MPDQAICGYGLATGPYCHENADPLRCSLHQHERFATCTGCGEPDAIRECPDFVDGLRCGMALCVRCSHRSPQSHGRVPTALDIARDDLSEALAVSLKVAADRGLLVTTQANLRPLAYILVDDLCTHTLLKMLSGLAAPHE